MELCLPDAHLTKLAGCEAMVSITDNCKAKTDMEAKLDCACDLALLEAYLK